MSTETGPDRPPQRTVAELLAAHGGGQPTSGRRRARRDAAEEAKESPSRHAESRRDASQSDGGQHGWPPAGGVSAGNGSAESDPAWGAPAGNWDRPADTGWAGGHHGGVDRQPESLNRRNHAQLPESPPDWRAHDLLSAGPTAAPARQPDRGWRPPDPLSSTPPVPPAPPAATDVDSWRSASSAPPPHRQSRRELREAREARVNPLEGVEEHAGGQLPPAGRHQSARVQRAARAPGELFVESSTDQIPRIAHAASPNGSNGHRIASAPADGRPAALPQRTWTVDPGPATGAMSPQDLLDGDGDGEGDDGAASDVANGDIKILGRSLTDVEAVQPADQAEDGPGPEEPRKGISRLSRRRTKPKRGARRRGKSKADVEETVLATGRQPAAPIEADVEPGEDERTQAAPAPGGDRAATDQAPGAGLAGLAEHAEYPADVLAGLSDSADPAPEVAHASPDPHPDAAMDSPGKAWLMIIAQLVGGAMAGAALWVGFRWLWGRMPPLALGAAVLALFGSVLLVRAIRRSDDLRTSLFAVFVGLVVTVSPAVLVLVSR